MKLTVRMKRPKMRHLTQNQRSNPTQMLNPSPLPMPSQSRRLNEVVFKWNMFKQINAQIVGFSGGSFFGGIVFAVAVMALGVGAYKFRNGVF